MTVAWLAFIRQTVWLPNSAVDLLNQHHFRHHRRQFHRHRHGDDLTMNCCYFHLREHHCRYRQIVAFVRNADQRNVPVIIGKQKKSKA